MKANFSLSGNEHQSQPAEPSSVETVTDLIYPVDDSSVRKAIDEYRKAWEEINGPTDLTKYYTSMWPKEKKSQLARLDLKQYFEGLPPFAQDWIRDKFNLHASKGTLDNLPDPWLRLYANNHLAPLSLD